MKKILLSIGALAIAGVVVVGATSAIFSDEETSTGNTFTAGAIDLTVDNESYYNGVFNEGTSWLRANLDDGQGPGENGSYWFFDFRDLKPGDWGEDTISLNVNNNPSYLCADVTLTSNKDNSSTEPELNDENIDGQGYTAGRGELGDRVNFIAWADDGDNVLEEGEQVYELGTLGDLGEGETVTAALADSQTNVWDGTGPLEGGVTKYIGKAWCFGDLDLTSSTYPQGDDTGPDVRGIVCDGSGEDNSTQTDSLTADISFRSVQSRHNEDFVCQPETIPTTGTITVDKEIIFTTQDNPVQISDFELHLVGPTGPNSTDRIVTDQVSVADLAPGDYTVSEIYNGDTSYGFEPTFGLDCTDSNSDDIGELTLGVGQNLTCRMTNREIQS